MSVAARSPPGKSRIRRPCRRRFRRPRGVEQIEPLDRCAVRKARPMTAHGAIGRTGARRRLEARSPCRRRPRRATAPPQGSNRQTRSQRSRAGRAPPRFAEAFPTAARARPPAAFRLLPRGQARAVSSGSARRRASIRARRVREETRSARRRATPKAWHDRHRRGIGIVARPRRTSDPTPCAQTSTRAQRRETRRARGISCRPRR